MFWCYANARTCLQLWVVYRQSASSGRAQSWQIPDLRAVQRCWHDAVPKLIVFALSYHPWWVRQGKLHVANLLCSGWTVALGSTSPSTTLLFPWPACVPGTGWGRGENGSCRNSCLTCLRLRVGKELQSALMGARLSVSTLFVEEEQAKLGGVVRCMLEAHCILHFHSQSYTSF